MIHAALALLPLALASGAPPVMDGFADASYGPPVVVQANQTQFGDSSLGLLDFANGTEIDACFARVEGGTLYLLFAGNLESNFNKLDVFFDSAPGGQNRLRGDNADIDLNGLNRMGDDGSGNGLTFDADFVPNYYVTATCGDNAPFRFEVRWAELLTKGGGAGGLAGVVNGGGAGNVIVGDNGIQAALDNTNIGGVAGGCGADDGDGVFTGVELAIPLGLLGDPDPADVRICAFVNGVFHDFVANQVLGSLDGACNLGEPRVLDFGTLPGDQHFGIAAAEPCSGDIDGDEQVGFSDVVEVLANWGPCVGCPQDVDGDDLVGFSDLLAVLAGWGPCP